MQIMKNPPKNKEIMAKVTKEKFKTYKNVFDAHSERCLFKLASQGHFDELIGPVSIGKEANIFTATKDKHKVIVKIYRLENCDFNKMYDYIKFDPRYINLKKNKRLIIFSWCKREFRNLTKLREAGVRVPQPIAFMDNIIVMEQIGKDSPAPKAKDVIPADPTAFINKIILQTKKMAKAGYVHGDLSEFNILNNEDKPVIIDLAQGTPLNSMNSKELIFRDAKNITRYAKKIGVTVSARDIELELLKEKKK